MESNLAILETADELAVALALCVADCALDAIEDRGRFLLAIPGGSAVSLLARGLPEPINASGWHIFWTDERAVPPIDPRSNYRLAQAELLPLLHGAQIYPINDALTPARAARAYQGVLAAVSEPGDYPRFDLVLLGIGEDGHVASLFPRRRAFRETQRAVAPEYHAPKPPPQRITLTRPVLNNARRILMVASGANKAAIMARVFGRPCGLPAQKIDPIDGGVYWLLDRAAAAKLKEPP